MERAQRKVSKNEEPPLPDLNRLSINIVRKKSHEIAPAVKDTTYILYDKPVWDNAELREELLDSDADDYLNANPPTEIGDNESTLDEIINAAQHDVLSNPIEHLHADETLFSDEDENAEDSVDLPSPKRGKLLKNSSVAYEGSLDAGT
ncbi:hypothetical protein WR25_10823 [Diploscapter pachys]|uniref:Uncharacterized protein n=1 Tax=Diploscapter pachys TaxID=2018661 RepID=A0A2A2JAY9_9BILA|nr:hypothetical protein WR25_10823 [Diploscapter pachys]